MEFIFSWKVRKTTHSQMKTCLLNVCIFTAFILRRMLIQFFSMDILRFFFPLESTLNSTLVIIISLLALVQVNRAV